MRKATRTNRRTESAGVAGRRQGGIGEEEEVEGVEGQRAEVGRCPREGTFVMDIISDDDNDDVDDDDDD
eukprot:12403758-Karenia_brevis.AAC.1